jgi:tRNA (guanine-N7-)-methyltransferase
MAKNKLKRFADNADFRHVHEPLYKDIAADNFQLKGQWHQFFGNDNPITVELGCGKGEYTIGLAELYPDRNFIGIDVKGARLWVGATYAHENKLNNVAFIRTRVDFLASIFAPGELSEIWITFPDPQHKKRKKRLTYPRFLEIYASLLKRGGLVNLKTDADKLYYYTLSVLQTNDLTLNKSTNDVYQSDILNDELKIQTFYESLFLQKGDNINFLSFQIDKKNLKDSNFDESLYEDARAIIPYDKKVNPSKLTE